MLFYVNLLQFGTKFHHFILSDLFFKLIEKNKNQTNLICHSLNKDKNNDGIINWHDFETAVEVIVLAFYYEIIII